MRIGIFGGTFDPIHNGHLLLAECCRQTCELDEVRFIPAAIPPHKRQQTITPDKKRLEMLRLALGGDSHFTLSDVEIKRGGISYSAETLQEIKKESPEDELFFLMGADSLADFPTWKDPQIICNLALPVTVYRHGSPTPDFSPLAPFFKKERFQKLQKYQVEMPIIDLSSTDLRERIAQKKSIRFRVPKSVERYIETNQLYQREKTAKGT